MLEASGVHVRYGDYPVLRGVTLTVGTGEFVAVVGPNGAGKTTLVHVLTGVLRPDRGTVRFYGHDAARLGPVRLARLGLARSFQLPAVFAELSVLDNLRVAVASRTGRSGRLLASLSRDRGVTAGALEVAALFGLDRYGDVAAGLLSGGDKKLLDVATAFALRPELIILDEPTAGVSTADKWAVMDTLVTASQQAGVRSIVAVEHDMELVFTYAQRLIELREGQVVADTTLPGASVGRRWGC